MIPSNNGYKTKNHCKFLIQYHIIWCPKFRFSVLGTDEVTNFLSKSLQEICDTYGYEIKAKEIMPDHIHIFVAVPHTVAPCDVARTLKSISAISMFKEFPQLKKFYSRCGVLWSRGYFISTIGHISEDTVRKYIEGQRNHHEKTREKAT